MLAGWLVILSSPNTRGTHPIPFFFQLTPTCLSSALPPLPSLHLLHHSQQQYFYGETKEEAYARDATSYGAAKGNPTGQYTLVFKGGKGY